LPRTHHQGSIAGITDGSGASVVGESYTPFGARRNANTWSGAASNTDLNASSGVTRQGYTFQTSLGLWMNLNHMNGRVQDAVTGRFISADPAGIDINNTQTFNRFSYVADNPLSYVDPTGFEGGKVLPIEPPPPPPPGFGPGDSWICAWDAGWSCLDNKGLPGDFNWGAGSPGRGGNSGTNANGPSGGHSARPSPPKNDPSPPPGGLATVTVTASRRTSSWLPDLCGWGLFDYLGVEGKIGPLKGEMLALVTYDSQIGGSHGALIAGKAGSFSGGYEWTRTWNDWQETRTPIGFLNGSIDIGPKTGPLKGRSMDFGLLLQRENGQLNFGWYGGGSFGGRAGGGGSYFSLSWTGCD